MAILESQLSDMDVARFDQRSQRRHTPPSNLR